MTAGHVFPDDHDSSVCKRCGVSRGAHKATPAYCAAALAYLAPGADKAELWREEQRHWASPDGVIVTEY